MSRLIYIASPYSSFEQNIDLAQRERVLRVMSVMRYISEKYQEPQYKKAMLYSPIVHFHNIAQIHGMPTDADFWWEINKIVLDKSDEMQVLMMEGWDKSIGVALEVDYSKQISLPLSYYNWYTLKPS